MALLGVPLQAASTAPQRILILDSFGREFAPYRTIGHAFREEMARLSPKPLEFVEVSLETVRFDAPEEGPVVDYIRALCTRQSFDLVVANGAPAAKFWQRYRADLLPTTPTLIAGAEERHFQGKAPEGAAIIALRLDLPGILRQLLALLPETRNIYVVIGDSPLERFWTAQLHQEWQPFEKQVRFIFWNDLSTDEMVRRSATLPPRSAIFFGLLVKDAAGILQEQEIAMDRMREVANAPLFSWSDNFLGHGIVGGPLLPLKEVGRAAGRGALRILAGEPVGQVDLPVVTADRSSYDWRELRRWGIAEARLPAGSTVLFQPSSALQKYQWPIVAAVLVIALQGVVIVAFLIARRRRRQAEAETVRVRGELAHAGRVSVMGQLSSSRAHELNQPLGAILRNAEAAELLLDASPPDLDEVRAILADIRKDDQRAGGVIEGIRALVRRQPTEFSSVDLAPLAERMIAMIRPDAQARHVGVSMDLPFDLPPVRGNSVQLQQVLLNLMVNGMEAMERNGQTDRTLRLRIRGGGNGRVEMAVSDSGPGIPPEDLPRIFENLYTTKPGGMGMGLTICRQIVEAHGGKIEAANNPGGGTTFRVTLPASRPAR